MTIPQLLVANCPRCGKVFQRNIRNQCTDCSHRLDSMLNSCLDFLRKNHRSTREQVSAATGATTDQIIAWMKEGRLLLADYSNLHYDCASCAKPIREHKLCVDCSIKLNNEIHKLLYKEQPVPFRREKQQGVVGRFQIRERLTGV